MDYSNGRTGFQDPWRRLHAIRKAKKIKNPCVLCFFMGIALHSFIGGLVGKRERERGEVKEHVNLPTLLNF